MNEVYQFKCLECNLEFKVGCGVGGSPNNLKTRFLCEDCGKISMNNHCDICGKCLKRLIFPLTGNIVELEETRDGPKLRCPHCTTENTVLTLIDRWVMNYQIW